MKKLIFALATLLFCLAFAPGPAAFADSYPPGYYDAGAPVGGERLTPEEMDDLLAPIALYPDPLIAQILPAATFFDQLDEAARYLRQFGRYARVDLQPWDLSVRAVAHYPDLLFMMDQKSDWTIALGQAFLDQQLDVMDAIQRLRADAQEQGNLFSTREQQVIDEPDGIRIVPAAPQYIYVPVYDPQFVYVERYHPSYPLITFGMGFAIGAWLSRDLDWRQHRVYYHGWRGDGWIGRSRPQIHDREHIYTGQRAAVINLNQRVRQHDTRQFRQELRHEAVIRREEHPRSAAPWLNQPRPGRNDRQRPQAAPEKRKPEPGRPLPAPAAGRPGVPAGERPHPPGDQRLPAPGAKGRPASPQISPATPQTPPPTPQPIPAAPQAVPFAGKQPQGTGSRPATGSAPADLFRGRDLQKTQPASHMGYGGYGSGKDASSYSQRGQQSQENMRQGNRPAVVKPTVAAPAPRPAPPVQRQPAVQPTPAPPVQRQPAAQPPPARQPMQQRPPAGASPAPGPAASPSAPGRDKRKQ